MYQFLTTNSLRNSLRASQGALVVKNPPANAGDAVGSLGCEDPLEEGVATHPSILAWRIPIFRGAWGPTVHGFQRVGSN